MAKRRSAIADFKASCRAIRRARSAPVVESDAELYRDRPSRKWVNGDIERAYDDTRPGRRPQWWVND